MKTDNNSLKLEFTKYLIDCLRGTCNSLEAEITQACLFYDKFKNLDSTDVNHEILHEAIFQCACCSWWCEINELNVCLDELICEDCVNDDNYGE